MRGDIDKEVAECLGISLATVRTYRKRICVKLGTQGLIDAALVCWRLGLLDLGRAADEILARPNVAKAIRDSATRDEEAAGTQGRPGVERSPRPV